MTSERGRLRSPSTAERTSAKNSRAGHVCRSAQPAVAERRRRRAPHPASPLDVRHAVTLSGRLFRGRTRDLFPSSWPRAPRRAFHGRAGLFARPRARSAFERRRFTRRGLRRVRPRSANHGHGRRESRCAGKADFETPFLLRETDAFDLYYLLWKR